MEERAVDFDNGGMHELARRFARIHEQNSGNATKVQDRFLDSASVFETVPVARRLFGMSFNSKKVRIVLSLQLNTHNHHWIGDEIVYDPDTITCSVHSPILLEYARTTFRELERLGKLTGRKVILQRSYLECELNNLDRELEKTKEYGPTRIQDIATKISEDAERDDTEPREGSTERVLA